MDFDVVDRDERIHADNWQDEPTEEDIERQRSIIEAQADLEEMYNGWRICSLHIGSCRREEWPTNQARNTRAGHRPE